MTFLLMTELSKNFRRLALITKPFAFRTYPDEFRSHDLFRSHIRAYAIIGENHIESYLYQI
jgi:hypothetical protein